MSLHPPSHAEARLRESELWFSCGLRSVADGVVLLEPDGRVRYANPAAEAITGWSVEEATGQPVDAVVPLSGPEGGAARQALASGRPAGPILAVPLIRRDGTGLRVDVTCSPVADAAQAPLGAVLVLHDASSRLGHEAQLRSSEQRFRGMFDAAPLGMALVSLEGHLLRANLALCRFLGRSMDELQAMPLAQHTTPADLKLDAACHRDLLSGSVDICQFEKRYLHASGRHLWALVSVSLLRDEQDAPWAFLYQVHDLHERKQSEQRLSHLAHHDPLTGLPNRARLRSELDRLVALSRRGQRRFAVVYMDLDRFKQVNDTLGHEVGDELLRHVADRLRATLREADFAARLGGDEFVLLLTDVHDRDGVARALAKVGEAVSAPLVLAEGETRITPSLGVSLYPDDGDASDTLLRHADLALYEAKSGGRNGFRFYAPVPDAPPAA